MDTERMSSGPGNPPSNASRAVEDTAADAAAERAAVKEAARCRASVLRHLDIPARGRSIALDLMGLGIFASKAQLANAELIRNQLITMMAEAEAFIAPADVCALLNGAAMHYPGDTLTVKDILTPTGYVYFDSPIDDPTGQYGNTYPIRALAWSVAQGDDPAIRYLDAPPDALMITLIVFTDTRTMRIPPPAWRPAQAGEGRLIPKAELSTYPRIYPIAPIVWQVGVNGGGIFWDDEETVKESEHRAPYIKTLMAWWAIMRQRLAHTEEVIEKPYPRELQRGQCRREVNDTLHYIRLKPQIRYRYTEYAGLNRMNPGKSWWVRSHWRIDYRAAARGEERYQLIPSYPKGDPDAEPEHRERMYLTPRAPRNKR